VLEKEQQFDVHKDLLCYYSKHFSRYFNGNSKEAQDQKLSLPYDDPKGWRELLEWVYGRRNCIGDYPRNGDDNEPHRVMIALHLSMKAVIIAEKFDMPKAKEACFDSIEKRLRLCGYFPLFISLDLVPEVYRRFPVDHRLRNLFTYALAMSIAQEEISVDKLKEAFEDHAPDAIVKVFMAYRLSVLYATHMNPITGNRILYRP
jgi:hypothetical protein